MANAMGRITGLKKLKNKQLLFFAGAVILKYIKQLRSNIK